nr:hypothetical protein [Sulfurovaceae bacterium]
MSTNLSFIKLLIFIFPIFGMSIEIDFNINKSVQDANITNKHIILFIHKDNCGYCDKMSLLLDRKDILKI